MTAIYSIEISYNLDKEYKFSKLELFTRYFQIIKEMPEIVKKDEILANITSGYT